VVADSVKAVKGFGWLGYIDLDRYKSEEKIGASGIECPIYKTGGGDGRDCVVSKSGR
jgi:hypothetical protein